jgi:O-antigen ligase
MLLSGVFGFTFFNMEDVNNGDRIGGLIDSVNQAGMIASLGQIFVLSFLFNNKQKVSSFIIFAAYGICLFAAVLTFSKAAFVNISLIFFTFLILLTIGKTKGAFFYSKIRLKLFILFLFSGLIIVSLNFSYIQSLLTLEQTSRIEQFLSLLNGNVDSETTTRRSDIGIIAIDYIIKNPLFGYGLGTFHELPSLHVGTHNEYLLVWGESGIIGLILYLLFIYYLIRCSFQIKNLRIKFLLLLFAIFFIVSSMVSHNILNTKFLILVMGLMLALSNNIVLINKNSFTKQ